MSDGSPLVIGEVNTASGPGDQTLLRRNETTPNTVLVAQNLHVGDAIKGEAGSGGHGVVGSSDHGCGVRGSSSWLGVFGTGTGVGPGAGVNGIADSNPGVAGASTSGDGVAGSSETGVGVFGGSDTGPGVLASSASGVGVSGSGGAVGVAGSTNDGIGVRGHSGSGVGVVGYSRIGTGMEGTSETEFGVGVRGTSHEWSGRGVIGSSDNGVGVTGTSRRGVGVLASCDSGSGIEAGSTSRFGVNATSNTGVGVRGVALTTGSGVYGQAATGTAVFGLATQSAGAAAGFMGSVYVTGRLVVVGNVDVVGNKNFKIDHPSDPENKYLLHTCVESSEMKNVYDGVAQLEGDGTAWVDLPEWFEALNQQFRYQLTAIGAPAPGIHIADEISQNRFRIVGGEAGTKISWQVTGVRNDRWAAANPLDIEQPKSAEERGHYLEPGLYDAPEDRRIVAQPMAETLRAAARPPAEEDVVERIRQHFRAGTSSSAVVRHRCAGRRSHEAACRRPSQGHRRATPASGGL
jgi:hypothetical protein